MRLLLIFLCTFCVSACAAPAAEDIAATPPAISRMVAPILTTPDAQDPYTYAQPLVARVTHVSLNLALNFQSKQVLGTATLSIDAKSDADTIVLDSRNLEITGITSVSGQPLPFTIGSQDPVKGAPITVTIGTHRTIQIAYRSAPGAEALQWLNPEQTAGGKHPYLLSQGQPTLNRSWIPTQDSPGIRQTWDAEITAPEPLTVVMSGARESSHSTMEPGHRKFRFTMDKPVAPYLIAIAAGDIVFRELGPRTGVWSEPAMIDRAAAELVDTERMVEAAEKLYGPYRWGRYDVIVLPPSFPYGGMENPVLTFLTPTFIAGDKSLVSLVAHELAHSWSGNLVTNATWADGWLNEGFTSYFENRVMEELYGVRRARQEEALSFADAESAMAEHGLDADITRLRLPPGMDDPDGSAGGIVYDKGATFLRTTERIVGRDRFDAWLRGWFDKHAFQPATSAMLLADMRANLVRGDMALEKQLMLEDWIYGPGWPANVARPDAQAFANIDAAVSAFGKDSAALSPTDWKIWTTAERLRFLNSIARKQRPERLELLDESLSLSATGNNEVLFSWLNLALANRYEPAVPVAEDFLARVGRRKFVLPLFKILWAQGDWGRQIATRIYAKTRSGYHAVTSGSVDAVVMGN